MNTSIVIPARYQSSRLPGKPLLKIAGKPMIQHVYERARLVRLAHRIVVATDDSRIVEAVEGFGGVAMMTSPDHPSGTDRLVEVAASIEGDLFVNIQGDEPLIRPGDVDFLIRGMTEGGAAGVGTLCHEIDAGEAGDPNIVKVVLAANGNALYFSRSLIPFPRDEESQAIFLKHVGIYAYRRDILENYVNLPVPMIESAEKLEQLRLLHAGVSIRAFQVEPTGPGVDTPESLQQVRNIFEG